MAIKPFEIQSPSLVLAGVQMQAGATGVVIPGVTQATSYSVQEVDDTGDQTHVFGSLPTVIDNGYFVILNGAPAPAGYANSVYTVSDLDGDSYITEIQVDTAGSFPSSYQSTVIQNMWATEVADAINNFNPTDWIQIPFAPQVRAGEIENLGGNASQLTNGDNSFVLDSDGNVVFQGSEPGLGVDRGLVWDFGVEQSGVNSQVRQDENGITVRAYTENSGGANGYSAPVNIVTNQDSTENRWVFDGQGNLTLPGNLIIPGNVSVVGTATGDVTNEGGIPGVSGSQTITAALLANPILTSIEPGWTVTGNNLTTTTLVTSIVEYSPGYYEITTDTTETNPFWYNDTYVLAGTAGFETWTFDSVGNLTIPGNISARGGANVGFAFSGDITNVTTGSSTVVVTIDSTPFPDPVSGQVTITGVSGTTEANGTWWFQAVMWNAFQLYQDEALTTPVDGTTWTAYAGGGFADNGGRGNISITANNVSIVTTSNSTWTFNSDGSTIFPSFNVDLHNGGIQDAQTLQFGNNTKQAVITGPTPLANQNAQRLIIQGQRGTGGEGGDVYLWGGDSDVNGGDIKIYAGDADVSGSGGYVNIDGGQGVNGGGSVSLTGGQSSGGQGGQINITAGYSGGADGVSVSINGGQSSGNGGGVTITGGYGQTNGGQVTITGGQSAQGLPGYANVVINAGASSWTFDNTGNLIAPATITSTSVHITAAHGNLVLGDATATASPGLSSTSSITFTAGRGTTNKEMSLNTDGDVGISGNLGVTGTITASNLKSEAPFTIEASNFVAVAGGRYGVDTWSADGPVTATLPASPSNGDAVFFADAGGYATSGALTIDAGTNTIMGGDTTMTVTTSNQSVGLFWNGRTWRTYNAG